MEIYAILQQPLCYSTFKEDNATTKCETCQCAWFSPNSNSEYHSASCCKPDYCTIQNLSGDECYRKLLLAFSVPKGVDHNTAAIFLRFQWLAFEEAKVSKKKRSDFGKNIDQLSCELRERIKFSVQFVDRYEEYYHYIWTCPGMPQLLLFAPSLSNTFVGLRTKFPCGRPLFSSAAEEKAFDIKYNTKMDSSGDWLGRPLFQILTQSCLVIGTTEESEEDLSKCPLINTNYALASKNRIWKILSDSTLFSSLEESIVSAPSLLMNVCLNSHEDLILSLNFGSFTGIIQLADIAHIPNMLEILTRDFDFNLIKNDEQLSIIETCCFVMKEPVWKFSSKLEDSCIIQLCRKIVSEILCQSPNFISLLNCGLDRRLEESLVGWDKLSCFPTRRICFAFIKDRVSKDKIKCSAIDVDGWLDDWIIFSKDNHYSHEFQGVPGNI